MRGLNILKPDPGYMLTTLALESSRAATKPATPAQITMARYEHKAYLWQSSIAKFTQAVKLKVSRS